MAGIYYHKKNDIWYFSVSIYGKQHHRSSKQTSQAAAKIYAEQFVLDQQFRAGVANMTQALGLPQPPTPAITCWKLLELWESTRDADTSEGHIRNVRDHVRHHLVAIHHTPIDQIDLVTVSELVKSYRDSHSIASTNGLKRTLNLLFSFALAAAKLQALPFGKLKKTKEPAKRRVMLTHDQYGALAASVSKARNPHIALMTVILAATGVRRSDVMNMLWRDTDLDRGTWCPNTIKDDAALYLPLDPWVISELKKFERVGPYVFCGPEGKPHGNEFLRRALKNAGKELGLGRLSPHALRSAYITHLSDMGVPISTISKLVDHSDVRLTMSYLVHTKQALTEGMRVAQGISQAAVAGMGGSIQAAKKTGPADGSTSE